MWWSRSPNEAERYGGGWKSDPGNQFDERFYDGKTYTPYVRLGGERVWDLACAGHVPDGHEDQSADLMLVGSSSWLRLSRTQIRVACRKESAIVMLATISLRSLQTFAIHWLTDRDAVILEVTARAFMGSPAEGTSHGQTGVLSMSMMFEPDHESLLQDLRRHLERLCGHDLTAPVTPLATTPAHRPEPQAGVQEEQVDFWEPDTSSEPTTSLPEEPEHEREAPRDGHREPAGGVRPGDVIRPAARILTVSAEVVPEMGGWLSYAAPSTQLLLAPSDGGGGGAIRSAPGGVHAQGDPCG